MTAEFAKAGAERFTLPGEPLPFFLREGERAHLFDSLVTVLLSKDETEGQFGVFTLAAPRGEAIPTHTHADVHEIFFVLGVRRACGSRTRRANDALGDGFTLLRLRPAESAAFERSARARGVPLTVVDLARTVLHERYGAALVLVRPDQHVAWRGSGDADAGRILDAVRGAG